MTESYLDNATVEAFTVADKLGVNINDDEIEEVKGIIDKDEVEER